MDYREKNKKAYNNWSDTYDDGNNPHIIMEHQIVLQLVSAWKWEKILDAGCGTWKYLSDFQNTGAEITACDFSEGMIEKAKQKTPNIPFDIVDLSKKLPYNDETFDKINCSQVLKHIQNIELTIKDFFRVLKKWWELIFSVSHPDRPKEMYRFRKQMTFNLAAESDIFHHRFFDYINAINNAWFTVKKIEQICLNEDVAHLIEEEDFQKMKGRPEIVVFNLKK